MTEEEIKQRNESKEFLKDLQYYLFQNKRSPKIDELSVLLDNDENRIAELEKENAELKKNYDDSLVAYAVLKAKVDTLAQPSPLESMQDVLITAQKAVNEKQQERLTKATKLIRSLYNYCCSYGATGKATTEAEQFLREE